MFHKKIYIFELLDIFSFIEAQEYKKCVLNQITASLSGLIETSKTPKKNRLKLRTAEKCKN